MLLHRENEKKVSLWLMRLNMIATKRLVRFNEIPHKNSWVTSLGRAR